MYQSALLADHFVPNQSMFHLLHGLASCWDLWSIYHSSQSKEDTRLMVEFHQILKADWTFLHKRTSFFTLQPPLQRAQALLVYEFCCSLGVDFRPRRTNIDMGSQHQPDCYQTPYIGLTILRGVGLSVEGNMTIAEWKGSHHRILRE